MTKANNSVMRVACLQMNSTADVEENLSYIEQQAQRAAENGVDILQLPENFAQMAAKSKHQLVEEFTSAPAYQGPRIQSFLSQTAKRNNLAIIAGSLAVHEQSSDETEKDDRAFARTLVFGSNGQLLSHYDKIHLFDVELESGQKYQESATYRAGGINDINVMPVQLDMALLGLTICYDLRFPELYRRLRAQGANIFSVPSAFTYETGKAHWQVLLQSRAIENSAFVFAAAQTGTHASGRTTWGHSMIIDPWGKVLACREDEPGLVWADLDFKQIEKLNQSFPTFIHRRM